MSDTKLARMQSLNERRFTLDYVVPLLKAKDFLGVEYTHGRDEYGRDIYFYDFDRFGIRRDMAAQVKVGNISTTRITQDVIAQAKAAFLNPFNDVSTQEERWVHGLYVITSGTISSIAKTEIINALRSFGGPITFFDGNRVLDERRKIRSEIFEWSLAETKMMELGLDVLLINDDDFENQINEILERLFKDSGKSPLQSIDELSKLLMGLPKVRERVSGLESQERDVLLHWYSVLIVVKAYYVYGRDMKFGIK